MDIIRPPRLRDGEVIALVSPASPVAVESELEAAVRYLESCGYRVKLGEYAKSEHGFLAGTDRMRAKDLEDQFRDPDVRAIIAVRGGYGTPRLLGRLDYGLIRRNPKILVGYSDLTALQLAVFRQTGLVTFSGPTAIELGRGLDAYTEENFWRSLTDTQALGDVPMPEGHTLGVRRGGKARGHLMGGNLSLLVSNMGTPYAAPCEKAILFLEEVSEPLHRVDRMLMQLGHSGCLKALSGLVLGQFTHCRPALPKRPHLTLPQILDETLESLACPVLEGLPVGHVARKTTLPIGVTAELDADAARLALTQAGVC